MFRLAALCGFSLPPGGSVPSCLMADSATGMAALDYLARGWSVIPAQAKTKRPAVPWKRYQTRFVSNKSSVGSRKARALSIARFDSRDELSEIVR
jgi:hypothetical protein